MPKRRTGVVVAIAVAVTAPWALGSGPASAHVEAHPPSAGIYRIPFTDGTDVLVANDHHTHAPVENRIDLMAADDSAFVAAAAGIIRGLVDSHGGPDEPSAVHSCTNDDAVPGDCTDYNNYVWIEHPNGEWTKYSHSQTGSVTANGWQVGDHVDAGDVLGLQGDVGRATGPHLHWEVAVPDDPSDPFDPAGGFVRGSNRAPLICDITGGYFVRSESYTAEPCENAPPTADAGGPYDVDEGSTISLDGSASDDPDGRPLTFAWQPSGSLLGFDTASPSFTGADDAVIAVTLSVYDQVEQIGDSDSTTITVHNVAPSVDAAGDTIDEGGTATIEAAISDPGAADTHTALVDWGDGTTSAPAVAAGAVEASHTYGDDGTFTVTVTVTDDDGGIGSDSGTVSVGNVAPQLSFSAGTPVDLPGGSFVVVKPGQSIPVAASGSDAGSDDLTFAWSSGGTRTVYNDGVGPEPLTPSPFGTFPFAANDAGVASYPAPGVQSLGVTLSDDDAGSTSGSAGVLVTGTATTAQDKGWWKQQYDAKSSPKVDVATADAFRQIAIAGSSVFAEQQSAAGPAEVAAILAPSGTDARTKARSELMQAWLNFASGAVAPATVIPGSGGRTFLQVVSSAEATILSPGATGVELKLAEQDLKRVQQVG